MIPTTKGAMSVTEIFEDLTYTSYKANREAAPDITPKSWEKVYGPEVVAMETRYQADKAIEKARTA